MEPIPAFEWRLSTFCNYRCVYCTQDKEPIHCSDQTLSNVLDFLAKSPHSWRVQFAGGEPTLHPRFFELCGRLASLRCPIGMTTNFSLSQSGLERLVSACGDNLDYVMASLHLDEIKSPDEFLDKTLRFVAIKNKNTGFGVVSVVREESFDRLTSIVRTLKTRGIRFEFQRDRNRKSAYPKEIEECIGGGMAANTDKLGRDFFGLECHTGRLFFVIGHDGAAVRCYDRQPFFQLGSFATGTFKLFGESQPCLSHRCSCTVPSNRNMICFEKKVLGLDIDKN